MLAVVCLAAALAVVVVRLRNPVRTPAPVSERYGMSLLTAHQLRGFRHDMLSDASDSGSESSILPRECPGAP